MPIPVRCPCGWSYKVADSRAGRTMPCPDCGDHVDVPDTARVRQDRNDAPRRRPRDDEDDAPRRRPRDDEDEAPRRRSREVDDDRPARRRDIRRREEPVARSGGVSGGRVAGIFMIIGAIAWFFGGLAFGYIFFYPPILLVAGIVALVRGGD